MQPAHTLVKCLPGKASVREHCRATARATGKGRAHDAEREQIAEILDTIRVPNSVDAPVSASKSQVRLNELFNEINRMPSCVVHGVREMLSLAKVIPDINTRYVAATRSIGMSDNLYVKKAVLEILLFLRGGVVQAPS